jgi:uncharacterized protein (DUF983 family)
MALVLEEAPGGAGLQVLCPNCSRMHDSEDYPAKCRRCGTLMQDNQELDMASVPDQGGS